MSHATRPNDEERFFRALKKVIEEPRFNPEQMADYMRQKLGVDRNDEGNHFNIAIDHYAAAAWAVRTYLRTPDV
jgi:hypothetical protein